MALRRQVSEDEKNELLRRHGRRCFVDGAPIPDEETPEFHHIRAFSKLGPTSLDNIAPVCQTHHRTIGTMSLQEYRDKLELERFFEGGDPTYLDDMILHKKGRAREKVAFEVKDDFISLFVSNSRRDFPLYTCPTTGWKYFYAAIPVEYVSNDSALQPRPLREASLWSLYRHFQTHTQLAPSICRMETDGTLLLFDGQHKAAAQIWSGRPTIECKVYLDPNPISLKETNLEAHGKLRQMSFYSHELMAKYADIFGEDWTQYMDSEGEKSEKGFFNFLVNTKNKSKAQARNEIALALYNEIINDPHNKLAGYLSEKHRGKAQPLTFARLKKTLLQHMLMPPPVSEEFESESDFRKDEKRNLVGLMTIIAEEGLEGRWNPERDDAMHKRTERVFSAGAVRAWTLLLKDTINTHLRHYTDDERDRFFYRRVPEADFEYFREFVRKLFSHKIWDDPDPTGEITARLSRDDATTAKSLFEEKGLTVSWLLGSTS